MSLKLKYALKMASKYKLLYIMLIPGFGLLILFSYVPMYGLLLAFKEYNINLGILRSPWAENNGLEYFISILSFHGNIVNIVRNTFMISFLRLFIAFPATLVFALLLNELQSRSFKKTVQTISYLPYFLSWVVVSVIIFDVLSPANGMVAYIFNSIGLKPISFFFDEVWFLAVLILSDMWKNVGWGAIIYLATIATIDLSQYDAADVEGANRFQKAFYITLPGVLPVAMVMFILSIGGLLSAGFDQIFNMYNASVQGISDIIDTYIYRKGFGIRNNYSYSTALNFIKNAISFILVIFANRVVKKLSDYSIW